MRSIQLTGLKLLLVVCAILMMAILACSVPGCSGSDGTVSKPRTDGGTQIIAGGGYDKTLFIVKKDGYKFAILVGQTGCSICQIIGPPTEESKNNE